MPVRIRLPFVGLGLLAAGLAVTIAGAVMMSLSDAASQQPGQTVHRLGGWIMLGGFVALWAAASDRFPKPPPAPPRAIELRNVDRLRQRLRDELGKGTRAPVDRLVLCGSLVDRPAVRFLRRVKRLRELDLRGARFTPDAFPALEMLDQVEVLRLAGTGIDAWHVRLLQVALPACRVLADGDRPADALEVVRPERV